MKHVPNGLTDQEKQCLREALSRDKSEVIAARLGIAKGTVDKRLESAMRKLGASGRYQAAVMFYRLEQGADPVPSELIPLPPPAVVPPVPAQNDDRAAVREMQVPYLPAVDRPLLEPPFYRRRPGRPENDLSKKQIAAMILAIAVALVLVFTLYVGALAALQQLLGR